MLSRHLKLRTICELTLKCQEQSALSLQWEGEPVEFYDNVSYTCRDEDTYFEWDRVGPWGIFRIQGCLRR